jgi:hypothetical protein
MRTILKSIIIVTLTTLITSCSFNSKDDTAWKKKLCEGYWEDVTRKNNRGQIIMVKFKFNENGTFDFNFGVPPQYWAGTWSLEKYPSEAEQERIIRSQEIVIKFTDNTFWGYSQFAMSMMYNGGSGFEIDENRIIFKSVICKLKHYTDGDKLIDEYYK